MKNLKEKHLLASMDGEGGREGGGEREREMFGEKNRIFRNVLN